MSRYLHKPYLVPGGTHDTRTRTRVVAGFAPGACITLVSCLVLFACMLVAVGTAWPNHLAVFYKSTRAPHGRRHSPAPMLRVGQGSTSTT